MKLWERIDRKLRPGYWLKYDEYRAIRDREAVEAAAEHALIEAVSTIFLENEHDPHMVDRLAEWMRR